MTTLNKNTPEFKAAKEAWSLAEDSGYIADDTIEAHIEVLLKTTDFVEEEAVEIALNIRDADIESGKIDIQFYQIKDTTWPNNVYNV